MWLRLAAGQGNVEACMHLSEHLLAHGRSAAEQRAGVSWMRVAATANNCDAQMRLSECYRVGQGVEASAQLAALWARKSLSAGGRGLEPEGFNASDLLGCLLPDPL